MGKGGIIQWHHSCTCLYRRWRQLNQKVSADEIQPAALYDS